MTSGEMPLPRPEDPGVEMKGMDKLDPTEITMDEEVAVAEVTGLVDIAAGLQRTTTWKGIDRLTGEL